MSKGKFLVFFIIIVLLLISCVYFSLYTKAGSKVLADKMISKFVDHGEIVYKGMTGNLANGLTFQNLEIKDIKNLPEGTKLKIQKLFFNVTSLNLNGIEVEIENTRLKLPDSDPIVISGSFKEQQLNLNIFSKGFTVNEILSYLPDFKKLIPIKGDVNEIDLYVTGSYLEPTVKGSFLIDKFIYKGFLLSGVPVNVDLQIKDVKSDVRLFGNVDMVKGELKTKKVLVKLDKGDLKFSGPWNQPRINFNGTSKIEKTKISIGLKGTIEKPDLMLSSEPSHSRQKLMTMLATGKSWQSVEDSIDNGLNSTALTKDFIDYFFFAGKSNQFANRFGISEFSVKFDENTKGVAAKKEISEKLEVGYGVEQSNGKDQTKDMTQKLEGEFKVSDKVSVGIEREIKQKQIVDSINEQTTENNDKVMIKYKKSF